MIKITDKIAFGGGCHWCTEAVFQSIKGVLNVAQGYVASTNENNSFSEAVIVNYNMECVNVATLIEIHLLTHNSLSNHSMRKKYRSAIYTFNDGQTELVEGLLEEFQKEFDGNLVTQVLPYGEFKPSRQEITNYYYKNPKKPFCQKFINPKLLLITNKFSEFMDHKKFESSKLINQQLPSL